MAVHYGTDEPYSAQMATSSRLSVRESDVAKVKAVLQSLAHEGEDRDVELEALRLGRCPQTLFPTLGFSFKGIKAFWEDGYLYGQELPMRCHGAAASDVMKQFYLQDVQEQHFESITEVTTVPANQGARQHNSDTVVDVRAAGGGWSRRIVVEIGNTQSLNSLKNLALHYLGPACPSIRYFTAIKRYPTRPSDGVTGMLAINFSRNNPNIPTQVISFGDGEVYHTVRHTLKELAGQLNHQQNLAGPWWPACRGVGWGNDPPCNGVGIPAYRLDYNVANVFHNLPVPGNLPANLAIDLFSVQRKLLDM